MSKKEHRLGVNEVNLVVRHLKLLETDASVMAAAIAEIDEIYGLDWVSFDAKPHVLNLAYDASRTCIECFEEILRQYEIEISHNWWANIKEGFYRYEDQNVKDNAAHEPFSCHKIPPHK